VIVPATREVGYRRDSGSLSAGEARVAIGVCERIVGLLAFPPQGRPRGTALVAGPEGVSDRLPGLLAVVALRSDRWRVHDLGPNVPASDVIEFIRDQGVEIVVVPAPPGDPAVRHFRAALEAATAVSVLSHHPDAPLSELIRKARR
jgi:hypothetical protein